MPPVMPSNMRLVFKLVEGFMNRGPSVAAGVASLAVETTGFNFTPLTGKTVRGSLPGLPSGHTLPVNSDVRVMMEQPRWCDAYKEMKHETDVQTFHAPVALAVGDGNPCRQRMGGRYRRFGTRVPGDGVSPRRGGYPPGDGGPATRRASAGGQRPAGGHRPGQTAGSPGRPRHTSGQHGAGADP